MTKRSFILSACAIAALAVMGCNESKDWNPTPECGNGVVELGEACEPEVAVDKACSYFNANTKWTSGRPGCSTNCRLTQGTCAGETPVVNNCGNGVMDAGEQCDGTSMPSNTTCESLVSGSTGTVSCNANCTLNISACVVPSSCGNNILDDGEECDGTYFDENFTLDCGEGMKPADSLVCVDETCNIDITQSCVVDSVACESDDDCAAVEGKTKCDEEKLICVEAPVACETDDDCAEVEGKPKCDEEKLICVEDTPVEITCESDDDCAEVEGKTKCDEDRKVCVEGPCTDGEVKCVSLPGILGPIAYTKCVDGVWEDEHSSTDCGAGLICSCGDGEGATCSSAEEACITNPDPDCEEGDVLCVDDTNYQVCNASFGFWSTGIGSCSEEGEGFVCDKTSNKCVDASQFECMKDEDCAERTDGKTACDTENKVCVEPVTAECTKDEDCADRTDGKTSCDTENKVCVEPASTDECTKDEDCADRTDGKTSCDTENKVCVEPASTDECTKDEDCADRTDGKTSCDTENKVCVEPASTDECTKDEDCADRTDGKTSCDTENKVCVEPASTDECTKDEDCADRTDGKTSCDTENKVCVEPASSGAKSIELDFSLACTTETNCTSTGSGYTTVRTYTIDSVTVVATGNFSDTSTGKNKMTLTGTSTNPSSIKVSGLGSVGTVKFDWVAYNPDGGKGTVNVVVDATTDALEFDKDTNGDYEHAFDSDATAVEIAPALFDDGGTKKNAANRLAIGKLTISEKE